MKVKSFLVSLLASLAIVGCSDEEVISVDSEVDKNGTVAFADVPAYITVSFSGSSNSSRAEVNGDKDGDAEDSGHHNVGLKAESQINEFAVIIKGVDEDGNDAANTGVAKVVNADSFEKGGSENEPVYTSKTPFKVLAGNHKVLIIANPVEGIKTAIENAKGYSEMAGLYNNLIAGKISDYVGESVTEQGRVAAVSSSGEGKTGFMMCNREEVSVRATKDNTQANPAKANVFLERVVSKISFRPTTIEGQSEANTYPITFNLTKYAYTVFNVQGVDDENRWFVLCRDAVGNLIAVYLGQNQPESESLNNENYIFEIEMQTSDDGAYEVYKALKGEDGDWIVSGNDLKEQQLLANGDKPESIPEDDIYYVPDGETNWKPEPVLDVVYKEINDYEVILDGYYITNLNNDLYVVRHTTTNATAETVVPFGYLDGNNYIADPYFAKKNSAGTEMNNNGDNNSGNFGETWFYNTLGYVHWLIDNPDASGKGDDKFMEIPKMPANSNDYKNSEHFAGETDNPGYDMMYCFENTVRSDKQKHGLTTGIVFRGKVVAPNNGGEIPTLYQYDGKVYSDLKEIAKYYGPANEDLTELDENSENADIIAAGVKIYRNDYCYYYTSQIKHFDNGDNNVAGIMEFAIVRNNIYSLAVKNIEGLGDATVNPDPDVDNESAVGYIDVEAKILPWIVRYQDIEF